VTFYIKKLWVIKKYILYIKIHIFFKFRFLIADFYDTPFLLQSDNHPKRVLPFIDLVLSRSIWINNIILLCFSHRNSLKFLSKFQFLHTCTFLAALKIKPKPIFLSTPFKLNWFTLAWGKQRYTIAGSFDELLLYRIPSHASRKSICEM